MPYKLTHEDGTVERLPSRAALEHAAEITDSNWNDLDDKGETVIRTFLGPVTVEKTGKRKNAP